MPIRYSKKELEEYLERYRYKKKHKKRGPRKKTPEEILELQRLGGKKSAAMRAAKGRKNALKVRRQKARIRKHQEELAERAKQREKAKIKRQQLKKKQHEIEKRKRKNARKASRRMIGKTYARKYYYIFLTHNGKALGKASKIGSYTTYEKMQESLSEVKERNQKVVFERKFVFSRGVLKPSVDEYIICRKKFPDDKLTLTNGFFRNQYGRLVEHKMRGKIKNLYMIDKFEARIEETFAVRGYDPRMDRKTFMWIYENIVTQKFRTDYDMKRIFLFKRQIVICNDFDETDIITCKCFADAIRFYNLLGTYCKSRKYLFMGNITSDSALYGWVLKHI